MISRKNLHEKIISEYDIGYKSSMNHADEDYNFNAIRNLLKFYEQRLIGSKANRGAYEAHSKAFDDLYGFSFISHIESSQEYYLALAYINIMYRIIKSKHIIDFTSIQSMSQKDHSSNSSAITYIIYSLLNRSSKDSRSCLLRSIYNIEWMAHKCKIDLHYYVNLIYKADIYGSEKQRELREVSE